MGAIDRLGPWQDTPAISERANDLMRENWLIVDECVRMFNDGELDDPDALEEFHDLMGQVLDIEPKYARARAVEFPETQRRWYVHAFGPDYERELGWIK